jgi:hypothetical protein
MFQYVEVRECEDADQSVGSVKIGFPQEIHGTYQACSTSSARLRLIHLQSKYVR